VIEILTDHFSRSDNSLKSTDDVSNRRMDQALDGPYNREGIEE